MVVPLAMNPARAAHSVVDSEKSLAFEYLPEWIKSCWFSDLMPTLIEFYGAQDNCWDLDDGKNDMFYYLLQKIIDTLYPEEHHVLVKPSKNVSPEQSKIYAVVS